MALEAYSHYWNSALGLSDKQRRARMAEIRDTASIESGFGGAGDPLGAQTPMIQDSMLQQLSRRASGENGRIDDWESLIDPTLTYGENLANILRKGGKKIDSAIQDDRENWLHSAPDRQQKHAKKTIRNNLEAVENGEKEALIEDISAEFGEAFVENAIAEAKALETPDLDAPTANREEMETTETPTVESETTATSETVETSTVESAESPEYSGIIGTVRLAIDYLTASYEAGKQDVERRESRDQTTIESYA